MMEPSSIVTLSTFMSGLGIVGIVVLFRSYQIDKFREKIFSLREEVFLYSLDEGLIDDIVYRNFRHLLNSLLRYAHKVTFLHVVALFIVTRGLKMHISPEPNPMAAWQAAVERLHDNQKAKFNGFNKKAVSLVVKHVIYRSILFWPLSAVIVSTLVVRGQVRASVSVVKSVGRSLIPINLLEAEALRASPPQSVAAES